MGFLLRDSVNTPIAPVEVAKEKALYQEVVHLASDEGFDLFKLVPAPTNTPVDAGPYITLGMCYATHPDTGLSDVTIHRMCIQGKDEISIFFTPGARHIGAMAQEQRSSVSRCRFQSALALILLLKLHLLSEHFICFLMHLSPLIYLTDNILHTSPHLGQ